MKALLLFSMMLLIVVVAVFSFLAGSMTGRTIDSISNYYSYTKAICNSSNYCQDYEIVCNEGKLLNMSSIAGAAVQHPSSWTNPRIQGKVENLCVSD